MKRTSNCVICKLKIIGKSYTLSTSHICKACHEIDYMNSVDVGIALNLHPTCITKYNKEGIHDRVPKSDAIRGKRVPIWKRSTVESFLKNKPPLDERKVRLLARYGINRKTIALLLCTSTYEINHLCNVARITIVKRTQRTREAIRAPCVDYDLEMYNRANKLLNKLVMA